MKNSCIVFSVVLIFIQFFFSCETLKQRPEETACLMKKEAGECKGHIIMWYFDNAKMKCKSFIYGGCGGNGNRFMTWKQCTEFCTTRIVVDPSAKNKIENRNDEDEGVNIGLVVGVTMGCAVAVVLIFMLALFFVQKMNLCLSNTWKHITVVAS
nr:PREDICTED: kappaPI-theraphotoxin-Hs1a-like isoform X2 [Latimeria chalumnae]|eukprot:XP_014348129.1 PREDICTED: kappaPI-theraphotoxin-Hs1a-like isoform X2 [Latimeria chalumnae]